MEKIEVIKLENIDGGSSYSIILSNEQNVSKGFATLKNSNLYYYLGSLGNSGWRIYSIDINTNEVIDYAHFYHINKTFLYGEIISSGKCMYGILGSTMHRNFASTDLMLIESDTAFNSLGISCKYPPLSHDKREWDIAYIKKEEFIARQNDAENKLNAFTHFKILQE